MTIKTLIEDRHTIIRKLAVMRPSAPRSLLIKLLKLTPNQLIIAATDSWMEMRYGVKPFGSSISVPNLLIPYHNNPSEFYQFITDCLKRAIMNDQRKPRRTTKRSI